MIKERINTVTVQRFDLKPLAPQIESVAAAFAMYLAEYPVRGASRHAAMGPVAAILERIRKGEASPGALLGYALRSHEMAGSGYISPTARRNLETGLHGLLHLVDGTPPTARARVLEQVEYNTYYLRRTQFLERMASVQRAWSEFLRQKYGGDVAAVSRAWGRPVNDFDAVPFPARRLANEKTALGADVAAFLATEKGAASRVEQLEAEESLTETEEP